LLEIFTAKGIGTEIVEMRLLGVLRLTQLSAAQPDAVRSGGAGKVDPDGKAVSSHRTPT